MLVPGKQNTPVPEDVFSYAEPLNADELHFLEKKAATDRSSYYTVFQVLMVGSFVIPFAGAWYRAFDGAANAFSPFRFFTTAAVLVALSSVSTYVAYRTYLRKIDQDIRDRRKTIEKSHVMKKVQIPGKGTFHLYIDSKVKLSIEVNQEYYLTMNVGDEISIEYATHSKEYLGYF